MERIDPINQAKPIPIANKIRRKSSFKESEKMYGVTSRLLPSQQSLGQSHPVSQSEPHKHTLQSMTTKTALPLPAKLNQQQLVQPQTSHYQSNPSGKSQSMVRRKTLQKQQLKVNAKTKDGSNKLSVINNESCLVQQQLSLQTNKDNANDSIQPNLTTNESEKQFLKYGNSDREPFLPDIYLSQHSSSKYTPDLKKNNLKNKLSIDNPNKCKQSPDEKHISYFNFQDKSATTTNQATEQYQEEIYRSNIVPTLNRKHTPKVISVEQRKVPSSGVSSIYGLNQSRQVLIDSSLRLSNSTAAENYPTSTISPKAQISNQGEQVLLNLQQQFLNFSKPLYDDQSDQGQPYNPQSSTRRKDIHRKVSYEEAIHDYSNGSLHSSKDHLSLTAQMSNKMSISTVNKIQLSSINEEIKHIKPSSLEKKLEELGIKRAITQKLDGKPRTRILQNQIQRQSRKKSDQIQVLDKIDIQMELEQDYEGQYLKPRTEKNFENSTKRILFKRKEARQNLQIVIIQFEGVLGEIMQRSVDDKSYQFTLRHGVVEGINELSKHLQVVIYSTLNDKFNRVLSDYITREEVQVDAIYSSQQSVQKSNDFICYKQIYQDFHVTGLDNTEITKIQSTVLFVCPLCLENDDIKDKEGEEILFQENPYSLTKRISLNLKGLPIESTMKAPTTLLVPHIRAQANNCSLSFLNVSNIIQSLLVTACLVREEQRKDLEQEASKDKDMYLKMFKEEDANLSNSRASSPQRSQCKPPITTRKTGLVMMTVTTISPKNHFKKILAMSKDRVLDQNCCNWIQAYYQVKRFKLFQLKQTLSCKLIPIYQSYKKQEDKVKLKQAIYKLKSLLDAYQQKEKRINQATSASTIQDLALQNEITKQSIMEYYNEFFKNLTPLLSEQTQNPLKDLISELEQKLNSFETPTRISEEEQEDIPLFRFLVIQGHQFQNYPLETKVIVTQKETLLGRNIFNWVVTKNYRKKLINIGLLNGNGNLNQEAHFQPGHRIFSDN